MRRLQFLTVLSFIFLSSALFAQDKEIQKEWAKKLKELKPLEYKSIVEERDALKQQSLECASSKQTLTTQLDDKTTEINKITKELDNAKKMAGTSDHHPSVASYSGPSKGIVFKVQIGNFKNKDLSKYFENNPNFSGEVDEDGTKKYTLGNFSDYWEADKFKKYMRDMGVKDAWIVSYRDGKRIAMKDALEGAL